MSRIRRSSLTLVALLCSTGAWAESFEVTDAQLARLGVTFAEVERVEQLEVGAGPAQLVVPPAQQALVSAPLGGVVARMLVAEGDRVERNQPVVELQSRELLAAQREFLDAAAQADLAAAQAERDRNLFTEGIIAQRRRDESDAAARAARALLDHTRTQLQLAGFDAAQLERLLATRAMQPQLVVRAPLAGVVAAVHAQVGTRLDALDPVLSVADLSTLWLELRLDEASAARVSPGMRVEAQASGATIRGTVSTVGRVVDPHTQTVLVRATLDDATPALRAGQFVTARVLAAAPSGVAHAVPVAALTRNGDEQVLFVRRGETIDARAVTVLAEGQTHVYLAEAPGGRVAVEGISALKALWLADEEGS